MKRFLKKLTGYRKGGYTNPPNNEDYEPAGIVHYGEYHIMLGNNHYSAYNQPDGSTDVYVNDEHLGNYPKDSSLWPIIEHAKENK